MQVSQLSTRLPGIQIVLWLDEPMRRCPSPPGGGPPEDDGDLGRRRLCGDFRPRPRRRFKSTTSQNQPASPPTTNC